MATPNHAGDQPLPTPRRRQPSSSAQQVAGKLQGRPGNSPPPVSKRQARRKRAKRRRKRLQDGSTPLSFLSAFGHMTLREMDTRAVLKGVHTLGLSASHAISRPLMYHAQPWREVHYHTTHATSGLEGGARASLQGLCQKRALEDHVQPRGERQTIRSSIPYTQPSMAAPPSISIR